MPVIYYVRHGLTDWNVQQRLQGHRDVPLNSEGRAQAVQCGEILRHLLDRDGHSPQDLDYVSSPLVRARETMELMRATLGLQPDGYRVDPRLAEISFGEWEGLTYADVLAPLSRWLPDAGDRAYVLSHNPRRLFGFGD